MVPSTSVIVAPAARATTYGSPPTALKARIEEFTPPGMARVDRSNIVWFDGTPAPVHTVGVQPAAGHVIGSQKAIVIPRPSFRDPAVAHALGVPPAEVREDDVGPGPLDGAEVFEGHGITVDPTPFGGRGRSSRIRR